MVLDILDWAGISSSVLSKYSSHCYHSKTSVHDLAVLPLSESFGRALRKAHRIKNTTWVAIALALQVKTKANCAVSLATGVAEVFESLNLNKVGHSHSCHSQNIEGNCSIALNVHLAGFIPFWELESTNFGSKRWEDDA